MILMKKKAGYFLIIDPQKNTLRISTEDEWLIEQVVKNNANIRKHKTIKELLDEVRDYLKGGGEDEEFQVRLRLVLKLIRLKSLIGWIWAV